MLLSHADLAGCTTEASISAFPGRPSPLSLLVLNINKSQTRKSQRNGCVEADWEQCKDPKPEGLKGRLHYSTILNVDEAYRFLKMLGLAPSTSQKSDVVSDGASELNRLLQTGRSSLQLKTGVSYGSGSGLVNVTGVGNAHFSGFLPVVRGEAGSHHPATLERMMVCTGRPCEPHSPPFQKAVADECDGTGASASTQGNIDIDEFLPSKHGYIIHLADGTETRT